MTSVSTQTLPRQEPAQSMFLFTNSGLTLVWYPVNVHYAQVGVDVGIKGTRRIGSALISVHVDVPWKHVLQTRKV